MIELDVESNISATVCRSSASRSTNIELRIVDRTSAINQTRSQLQRIRRIMYALHQENWVPSYVPDLSDAMVLELFWSYSRPPTLKEIEDTQLDGWAEPSDRRSSSAGPLQSDGSPSGTPRLTHDALFLTFLGKFAEEEFCVFFYRKRFRSTTMAVCTAGVIVIDCARLYPTFSPSRSSAGNLYRGHSYDHIVAWICSLVAFIAMLSLAATTRWLSRQVQLHDAGIAVMTRTVLRQNARWQEAAIGAATLALTSFVGTHVAAEQACPFVDSVDGQLAFCRKTLGNVTATFAIACALPSLGFPVRFVLLTKLYACMLAMFLAMNTFLHDARSDSFSVHGRHWTWGEIVACRMVFVLSFCGWFLIHQWRNEMVDRVEFNDACRLEAISLDLKSLRQSLALKVRAIVPSFVARKLLVGEKVLDQNPHGIILSFGVVNMCVLYTALGCADVVALLNRVFSSLDHVVSKVPCVTKMQTFGDLYVCVSGVAGNANCMYYPLVMQAGDPAAVLCHPLRRLATNMQITTSGFATVAIALHVGPVAGMVLGKCLSYVAVGDGVSDCIKLMRSATKQSILCSASFESAQVRGAKWAHCHKNVSDADKETSLSSSLDDDETALLQGLWCSVRRTSHSTRSEVGSSIEAPLSESRVRDYAMERRCLIVNQFKDPEVEAAYCATFDGDANHSTSCHNNVLDCPSSAPPRQLEQDVAAAHRNVFGGALFVAMLNLIMFGIMDAKYYSADGGQDGSNEDAVALWAGGALLAVACIVMEKLLVLELAFSNTTVRLYIRRVLMIVLVLLNHLAYYRLDSRSFLLHNVEPQVMALLMVSLGRRRVGGSLYRSLAEDTVFLVAPMLWIQLRRVWNSDTLSLADGLATRNATTNASAAAVDDGTRLKITEGDAIVFTLQFVFVIALVFPFASSLSRFLSDVDMRHYFGTRSSLADETFRLQEQHRSLRSFVDAAFPQFVAEKLHGYVSRHIENGSGGANLTGDVDPWLGSWFAMGVVDSPMAVVHFSRPSAKVELIQVIAQLEGSHQIMDEVLQRLDFAQSVCASKTIGDMSVLIGAGNVSEPISALHLLQCAVALHAAFKESPVALRVVLNSGLTTGAVIGTDRVAFEMYGEVIATSTQILDAMPLSEQGGGVVATNRFVRLVVPLMEIHNNGAQSLLCDGNEKPSIGEPSLWKIRGSRGAVLVHWVAV